MRSAWFACEHMSEHHTLLIRFRVSFRGEPSRESDETARSSLGMGWYWYGFRAITLAVLPGSDATSAFLKEESTARGEERAPACEWTLSRGLNEKLFEDPSDMEFGEVVSCSPARFHPALGSSIAMLPPRAPPFILLENVESVHLAHTRRAGGSTVASGERHTGPQCQNIPRRTLCMV